HRPRDSRGPCRRGLRPGIRGAPSADPGARPATAPKLRPTPSTPLVACRSWQQVSDLGLPGKRSENTPSRGAFFSSARTRGPDEIGRQRRPRAETVNSGKPKSRPSSATAPNEAPDAFDRLFQVQGSKPRQASSDFIVIIEIPLFTPQF